jgi:hypothetical protein
MGNGESTCYIFIALTPVLKKTLSLISVLFITASAFAQDYSGLWVGLLRSDMPKNSHHYKLFLQLNQSGKAVWGVYTSGNDDSASDIMKANCACRVSSINGSRKEGIQLYRDKVIAHTISLSTCEALVSFSLRQSNNHDTIFLKGTWTGIYRSAFRKDDASGEVSLIKISDASSAYINQYFPDLEKWIKKVNKGKATDGKMPKEKNEPIKKATPAKDSIQAVKPSPGKLKEFDP